MANAKGKTVDTTYLHLVKQTSIRGYIHRDYLAHCLRYSHIAKFMHQQRRHQTAHLLDVGCGRETPLPRLLFSMMMTHTTGSYTGVDYGGIPWPETIPEKAKSFHMKLFEKSDFVEVDLPRKKYDVITSFEVLEHVEADHAFAMMQRMRQLIKKNGYVFLSTPCYDPRVGAAANHVNEMSHDGFKALILAAGFNVDNVWGTFASQRDYKEAMGDYDGLQEIFDQLKEYYDSGVVSCLMAPLFPEESRNCLWRLTPGKPMKYGNWRQLCDPEHGSSKAWPKQLRKILKGI